MSLHHPLTLKRTLFSGRSQRVSLSPSWVSNGHFAVHKSRVTNAAIFRDVETAAAALNIDRSNVSDLTDEQMDRVIPKNARIPFYVTRWSLQSTREQEAARLLVSSDGDFAFIGEGYCQMLQLQGETLYCADANGQQAFCDDHDGFASFLLMPMRGDSVDALVRSLGPVFFQAQATDEIKARGEAKAREVADNPPTAVTTRR